MKNIEQREFKKKLDNLSGYNGNGTSMITLLIPGGYQISLVNKMLIKEVGTASNIKSHVNKLSVETGIRGCQEKLKLYKSIPPNGLVICVGSDSKVSVAFEPIKPFNQFLYRCDNKFHLDILYLLLNDDKKYGFIIVDGNGCLFGTLCGSQKTILHRFSVELPKKHRRGGQSSVRFSRLRTEARHNYVRKISESATSMFIFDNMCNVEGLILAGSADFKNVLNKSDLFDKRLQEKVILILDLQYGDERGFNQAIVMSAQTLNELQYISEITLLSSYFSILNKDASLISYGTNDTLYCLLNGAVKTLIINEDCPIKRFTLNNNEVIYSHIIPQDKEIILSQLLLDWLIENINSYGAKLEMISNKTPEGNQFIKGFGGIGGILRYAVAIPNDNSDDNNEFNSEDFI
jgi:peptide chain release factor subunit 1